MSLVGKKFPNITVDAISEMGDNLRINIFEEATKNHKKVLLFWLQNHHCKCSIVPMFYFVWLLEF